MTARRVRLLRIATQTIVLVFFLFLIARTEYGGTNELRYPVRIFLEIDPLITLGSFLASRGLDPALPSALLLSLILVAATVILGRFFCGWVCPLGTLFHLVGRLAPSRRRTANPGGGGGRDAQGINPWRRLKYFILIFILASALAGSNLVGWVDPISLLIRSLAVSIWPLMTTLVRSFFNLLYSTGNDGVTAVSEPVYEFLSRHALSFGEPRMHQAFFIGLIFLVLLALNLVRSRFWCNYLCPLGAGLGLLSRWSAVKRRVGERCNTCELCLGGCQGGAVTAGGAGCVDDECLLCLNCDTLCPVEAVSFEWRRPFSRRRKHAPSGTVSVDLRRRGVLTASALGLASVALFRVGRAVARPHPRLIRPPGSLPEEAFVDRCIRCGECMKVCLTHGLQPTFLEAGFEGMWTPRFDMRLGYCEYYCTLCGQVCPTQAIRELTVEEKQKEVIGLAFIDQNRCLPYAWGVDCIVCEEHCPTPEKAIWFEEGERMLPGGERKSLKLPRVNPRLCIGCGICENKCPVGDRPAIYVTSIGESRSRENRLLLAEGAADARREDSPFRRSGESRPAAGTAETSRSM